MKGWWALAAIFAGLAGIMLSESLLRSRQELLYSLSPTFSQCFKQGSDEICTAQYELALANSGVERQETVQVRWAAAFARWEYDWSASDLVGSAQVRAKPVVRAAAGELRHEVHGLEPNTLLEFKLRCTGCSRAQVDAARKASVQIEGRGKIIEAEPRATILGRLTLNIARLAKFLF